MGLSLTARTQVRQIASPCRNLTHSSRHVNPKGLIVAIPQLAATVVHVTETKMPRIKELLCPTARQQRPDEPIGLLTSAYDVLGYPAGERLVPTHCVASNGSGERGGSDFKGE